MWQESLNGSFVKCADESSPISVICPKIGHFWPILAAISDILAGAGGRKMFHVKHDIWCRIFSPLALVPQHSKACAEHSADRLYPQSYPQGYPPRYAPAYTPHPYSESASGLGRRQSRPSYAALEKSQCGSNFEMFPCPEDRKHVAALLCLRPVRDHPKTPRGRTQPLPHVPPSPDPRGAACSVHTEWRTRTRKY